MSAPDSLLVRFAGDIATKSRGTRAHFLRRLQRNLAEAFRREGVPATIDRQWTRLLVATEDPRAAEVASRVFGVQSVSRSVRRPWRDLDELVAAGRKLFAPQVAGRTY